MCVPESRKTKVNKTNQYNSDHRLHSFQLLQGPQVMKLNSPFPTPNAKITYSINC